MEDTTEDINVEALEYFYNLVQISPDKGDMKYFYNLVQISPDKDDIIVIISNQQKEMVPVLPLGVYHPTV